MQAEESRRVYQGAIRWRCEGRPEPRAAQSKPTHDTVYLRFVVWQERG